MKVIKKMFGFMFGMFRTNHKYAELEQLIIGDLQLKYRNYQMSKDILILKELVSIVDFCNRVKINGDTELIKREIINTWEYHISEEKRINKK